MSFFESMASPPPLGWRVLEDAAVPRPPACVPGAAAVEGVLGRSSAAVVSAVGAFAYNEGVELYLVAVAREAEPLARWRDFVHGDARLGVVFSDGRQGSSIDPGFWEHTAAAESPAAVACVLSGGNGGARRYTSRWWVAPLPSRGPLELVFEWRTQLIAETRTTMAADAIVDAARRSFDPWA